jgi:hypothetical protein
MNERQNTYIASKCECFVIINDQASPRVSIVDANIRTVTNVPAATNMCINAAHCRARIPPCINIKH